MQEQNNKSQSSHIKTRFGNLPKVQPDPLFATFQKFKESNSSSKINLSIGMLQDEKSKYIQFNCVKTAEEALEKENLNKEYPIITGNLDFNESIKNLFFPNKNNKAVQENRILVTQPVTGGASLRMVAEVLKKFLPKKIHLSNLTFSPYFDIFEGFEIFSYPYYNSEKKVLDFPAMKNYFSTLEKNSIVLFQLSSHNPTALDLNPSHWDELLEIFKTKHFLVIFDAAYLGYANGSFAADLYPIEKFSENNIEMLICYSSAKNFTNYCDDIGALLIVLNKKDLLAKLKSHLILLARSLFSFPSLYGSRIISKIYNDEQLKKTWMEEQKIVYERIIENRKLVVQEMIKKNLFEDEIKNKSFVDFINSQKGIYLFLDLNDKQVERLADEFLVFTATGGRVNLTGINKDNVERFVDSVKKVLV